VLNAVHCTDLPEDGRLEVQYIFSTLLGWCLFWDIENRFLIKKLILIERLQY
jgi:hypothetical protein